MIPCANPGAQYRANKAAVQRAVNRVFASGRYVLGAEVSTFERKFAEFINVKYAVGVASGTDALTLALRALEVGAGDEVITVSHTALATVAAIIASRATPVLVDVDPKFSTIDSAGVARAITNRTKAIIAVHLYGQAADLRAIKTIAAKHKIAVVEDCAQAAGARYHGRRLGSIGTISAFSFYPTKNLGAMGDGGAVVTGEKRLAERVTRLRQYGWDERRETRYPGVNSRLDPLQAAILTAKLPNLDADNARRASLARRYTEGLTGLPVTVPVARPGTSHAFHLYVIGCHNRDALAAHLNDDGIDTAVHYRKPVHRQRGYAELIGCPQAGLPVTDRLARRILSLPLYPELKPAQVDRVIASIRRFYSRRA